MSGQTEVWKRTLLVSHNRILRIQSGDRKQLNRDPSHVNILITGMPRTGKTEVLKSILDSERPWSVPFNVVFEHSPEKRPEDLANQDWDAMMFNLGFAAYGMLRLIEFSNVESKLPTVTIFERGLIDQIVFASALSKGYGNLKSYDKVIKGLTAYFAFYLSRISGIVLCNAKAETVLERGSKLQAKLLEDLSLGYRKFPGKLARIARGGMADPTPVVVIESECHSEKDLEESIYKLVDWGLDGEIIA